MVQVFQVFFQVRKILGLYMHNMVWGKHGYAYYKCIITDF